MDQDQYTALMEKLGELQGDFREHKGITETEIRNIVKKMDTAEKWENIKIVCVLPVVAALHHFFGGKG